MLRIAAIAFVTCLVGCEIARRFGSARALRAFAHRRALRTPLKPRLAGAAVVASVVVVYIAFNRGQEPDLSLLLGFASIVALIGLVDDLRPLRVLPRLAVHVAAASAFISFVDGGSLQITAGVSISSSPLLDAGLVVWLVAVLNLYNFMDGMDGLAGSQAIGAALGQGVLLARVGCIEAAGLAAAVGASSAGFLLHNLPPARIFLGDGGATFLGFTFAALAIIGAHHGVPLTDLALPLSPFLLDATFTLLARLSRGELVWRPHQSHLYQRAARTGSSPRDVLFFYAIWMLGCAGAVTIESSIAKSAAWACSFGAFLVMLATVRARELDLARVAQPRDLIGDRRSEVDGAIDAQLPLDP